MHNSNRVERTRRFFEEDFCTKFDPLNGFYLRRALYDLKLRNVKSFEQMRANSRFSIM